MTAGTRKPIEPAFAAEVGRLAEALGRADFAEQLLAVLGALVATDMTTMTRYSRFSKPDYLVYSENYAAEMAGRYLADYYRFDPFYRYWRSTERPGVVWLGELSSEDVKRGRYMREFLSQSGISDEIGVFLPPFGGASVALFLERTKGRFSARDRQVLQDAYPVVAGLHRAHVNALFGAAEDTPESAALPGRRPLLVTDAAGNRVFANAAWDKLESAEGAAIAEARARLAGRDGAEVGLTGERVLHRESLDAQFRLAPGGYVWTLERRAQPPEGHANATGTDLFEDTLTRREREIVALILDGHPTITIAQKLGLSRGTVKNHRRRIYYKLDITTERELFLLYIEGLSRGGDA